jgi:putative peptide zinc metalloprotease protein
MRVRARAQLVTVAFLALLFGSLGLIPAPYHGRGEGVVEPGRIEMVFAGADGFIENVLPSASAVKPDGPDVVDATNHELEIERRRLMAQRGLHEAYYRQARSEEPAQAQVVHGQIEALDEQIARIDQQLNALSITTPFEGVWFSEKADSIGGAFVKQGEPIGILADTRKPLIRVTADQYLGPELKRHAGPGAGVEMRVRGRPDVLIEGRVVRVLEAARRELPSAALGYVGGGSIAVDTEDQEGRRAAEPFFEVQIDPVISGETPIPLHAGQRVVARFDLPNTPYLTQWWLAIRQVIQQRF